MQQRRGRPGLTAFADAAGRLEVLIAEGSRAESDALHTSTLALAPERACEMRGGRGASRWRGSEVAPGDGRLVLVRTLAPDDGPDGRREAALSVACAPPEPARGRLIAASFRRGPGPALLPAPGSALGTLALP